MGSPELSGSDVVVTGGCGFIGSNLTYALSERGANATVVDVERGDVEPATADGESVRDVADVVQADVRDLEDLVPVLSEADLVYHLAGRTDRVNALEEPLQDTAVNALGTVAVLEAAARQASPPRVVLPSSAAAVGRSDEMPLDGTTAGIPVGMYGANKRALESYAGVYQRAKGVPTVTVRLANVYGPHTGPGQTFVDAFVSAALKDEPVTVFDPGETLRDAVYLGDVVDAFLELGHAPGVVGERYAVGTGRPRSIREIAELVVERAGTGRVELVPRPEEWERLRVGDLYVDPSRLQTAVDWTPRTELADGLDRTIDYWRSNRDEFRG